MDQPTSAVHVGVWDPYNYSYYYTDINAPEDNPEEIKFALAWSKKIDSKALHLPTASDSIATNITPSASSSSLNMEAYNVDEITEKLQHESNIYMQADFLNLLYTAQ